MPDNAPPLMSSDHDLLVRLDTKLDVFQGALNSIRLDVSTKADAAQLDRLERVRVDKLEAQIADKVDKERLDLLETKRLDKLEAIVAALEKKVWTAAGGLAVVQFAIHYLLPTLTK